MPVRRTRRRRPTRRPRRKTYRLRRKIASGRRPQIVPRWMRVMLPYSEHFKDTLAAGVIKHQVWSINSIYDPDVTGTGHYPMGYAQWNNLYNRYRVNGFGYKFNFQEISSGSNPVEIFIYIDNQSAAPVDARTMRQKPYVKQLLLGADNTVRTIKGGTMAYRPFGVTKMHYYNDDYYSALFTASPTRQAYLHVCYLAADSTPTVICNTSIRYYVTLYDQNEFPASSS